MLAHGTAVAATGAYALGNALFSTGGGEPSPFLPNDPYSPESVSKRQSETRRELETGNNDPDSPIPDQGPGKNIKDGVHTSEGKEAHRPGERNVAGKGMEEHNIVPPGTGGTGRRK
jgi:hypothetical protein